MKTVYEVIGTSGGKVFYQHFQSEKEHTPEELRGIGDGLCADTNDRCLTVRPTGQVPTDDIWDIDITTEDNLKNAGYPETIH
jgi:hypothetical protein